MTDRDSQILSFLEQYGWDDSAWTALAGDASSRRYIRLTRARETAILMDAPPQTGETVTDFVRIAAQLRVMGLSAPECLAQDTEEGFVLLEDLGDALFARLIADDSSLEIPLTLKAVDVLVHLHKQAAPSDLPRFDPSAMSETLLGWYVTMGPGRSDVVDALEAELKSALCQHVPDCSVMILRDYHSENLLWLPERKGILQAGLLDFQDAKLGHPAYDLASLLTDARRDVSADVQAKALNHYLAATNQNIAEFETAYALLCVQRNLRILGIFARLALAAGKPHYIAFMPRVWGHIRTHLRHPALAKLDSKVLDSLQEPGDALFSKFRTTGLANPQP